MQCQIGIGYTQIPKQAAKRRFEKEEGIITVRGRKVDINNKLETRGKGQKNRFRSVHT